MVMEGRWKGGAKTYVPKYICDRCKVGTDNPTCMNCGRRRCEPCFQFGKSCCEDMKMEDGSVPTLKLKTSDVVARNTLNLMLLCKNDGCLATISISNMQYPKITRRAFRYCPICGSDGLLRAYNRNEMWDYLGNKLGLGTDLTKELYAMWVADGRTVSFKRFVRSSLAI